MWGGGGGRIGPIEPDEWPIIVSRGHVPGASILERPPSRWPFPRRPRIKPTDRLIVASCSSPDSILDASRAWVQFLVSLTREAQDVSVYNSDWATYS